MLTLNPPVDADEWMENFAASAANVPFCIVVSDMSIPGVPMIHVNEQFILTTGYSREESIGRNCRFLQGPETEPDAVLYIQESLAKGENCHIKLKNYRRNGEIFTNLLSIKAVYDSDNIFRFSIGIQFEVKEQGSNLKERLREVDILIRQLPSKINLPSRTRPTLATVRLQRSSSVTLLDAHKWNCWPTTTVDPESSDRDE